MDNLIVLHALVGILLGYMLYKPARNMGNSFPVYLYAICFIPWLNFLALFFLCKLYVEIIEDAYASKHGGAKHES